MSHELNKFVSLTTEIIELMWGINERFIMTYTKTLQMLANEFLVPGSGNRLEFSSSKIYKVRYIKLP